MADVDARVQFILDAQDNTQSYWDELDARMAKLEQGYAREGGMVQTSEAQKQQAYVETQTILGDTIDQIQRLALMTDLSSSRSVELFQEAAAAAREDFDELGAGIERYDQLDAIVTRVQNDVKQLGQAELLTGQEAQEAYEAQNTSFLNMESGALRASRAATGLGFALGGMGRGGRFAAMQLGMLAQSLASLSESAAIAEAATGIGAILTIVGGLAILWEDLNQKEEKALTPLEKYQETIKHMNFSQITAEYENQKKALEDDKVAMEQLTEKTAWYGRVLVHIGEAFDDVFGSGKAANFLKDLLGVSSTEQRAYEDQLKKAHEAEQRYLEEKQKNDEKLKQTAEKVTEFIVAEEKKRSDASAKATLEAWGTDKLNMQELLISGTATAVVEEKKLVNTYYSQNIELNDKVRKLLQIDNLTQKQREDIQREASADQAAYKAELDAGKARILILEEERDIKLKIKALEGDPGTVLKAKLVAIEQERLANIRATEDEATANRLAHQERIKLLDDYVVQSEDAFQKIYTALINSKNKEARAVAHAAETIRKIEIAAEAAKSAVLAAQYTAKSIAAFASFDPVAGAGFAAAAIQAAAAAALGFSEAGGGGAGAGGGGAPPAGTQGSFTGNNQGGGQTNIQLLTRDPYSGDAIQAAIYSINQSNVLKTPINVPPTTGLSRSGG